MSVVSGESTGVVEVTPSGIPVYYQSKPKRLYRIGNFDGRETGLTPDDLAEDAKTFNQSWREVPSVTQVLDVLHKGGLTWWGMKVGIEGVREFVESEALIDWNEATCDYIVRWLKANELTVNHVRDKAGDRGQAVHDALETWAKTGHRPDPSIYPEEEVGYIKGLLAFLKDVPTVEPLACEVLVASSEYGYAGRYDLRLRTSKPHDVVVHRTPVRGPQYKRLMPGELLGDLKTSSGIYASHARQLEAYEQASIESGYEPTVARAILHVGPEGTYELVRSWATFVDFECVLKVYQSEQEMKARKKAT